jgi:hypothetical protein
MLGMKQDRTTHAGREFIKFAWSDYPPRRKKAQNLFSTLPDFPAVAGGSPDDRGLPYM